MRFILYNIRYGTGLRAHNYFRPSGKNLGQISAFLLKEAPDLVGLIEVDHGSYRTGWKDQAEQIAASLGHYHAHSIKYQVGSLWRNVPVLSKQGNAFLARDRIRQANFHFFVQGMKRLVLELEMDHVVVFLVHLALGSRVRHYQLGELYKLVKETKKPYLVAGDFNALWGEQEIDLFLAATGLQNANREKLPTYPSRNPRRHLDFVLYSPGILIRTFNTRKVLLSDHLPLVVDFDVKVPQEQRHLPRVEAGTIQQKGRGNRGEGQG